MGSGVAGLPRPLLCYTNNPVGVHWLFPNGTRVRLIKTHSPPARGKDVFSWTGIVDTINRGPDHLVPRGILLCAFWSKPETLCYVM